MAIDESQLLNRNAWDEVQQTLSYTNAEVTHGSNVVTMANTSPMLVGDSVTITVGSTTLNSTINSISANNTSITVANRWTGSTSSFATVNDNIGDSNPLPDAHRAGESVRFH